MESDTSGTEVVDVALGALVDVAAETLLVEHGEAVYAAVTLVDAVAVVAVRDVAGDAGLTIGTQAEAS